MAALDRCLDRVDFKSVRLLDTLASSLLIARRMNASSFANLSYGLLYRQARHPSKYLLSLEFIGFLLERVDSAAEEVQRALDQADGTAEAQHNRHLPRREAEHAAAHEATKGGGPSILLFAQVHRGPREEGVGGGCSGADSNDGGAAGKDCKGANVAPGHGVADRGEEEAASEADRGGLGRLVEDVVGRVGPVSLRGKGVARLGVVVHGGQAGSRSGE